MHPKSRMEKLLKIEQSWAINSTRSLIAKMNTMRILISLAVNIDYDLLVIIDADSSLFLYLFRKK